MTQIAHGVSADCEYQLQIFIESKEEWRPMHYEIHANTDAEAIEYMKTHIDGINYAKGMRFRIVKIQAISTVVTV